MRAGGRKIVVPFGVAEGVAVYMNGTDLPEEVYKTCDSGVVIDTLQKLVETEDGGRGVCGDVGWAAGDGGLYVGGFGGGDDGGDRAVYWGVSVV